MWNDTVLRKTGMQINHMRHDGSADDAYRQKNRIASRQARHKAMKENLAPIRLCQNSLHHIAECDHPGCPTDKELQSAKPSLRGCKNSENQYTRDNCCQPQRNVEQQIEPDRRPEKLRKVRCHGREFLRDPQRVADPPREADSAHLSKVFSGGDSQ